MLEPETFQKISDAIRGQKDYPPTEIQTPEGVHFDTITSRDVAETSSSGVAERSIAKPEGESRGGTEKIRDSRQPRPAGSAILDDIRSTGEKAKEKFIDSLAPVQSVLDEIGGVGEVIRDPKDGGDGYTDWRKSTDLVAAKEKANGRIEHEMRDLEHRVGEVEKDYTKAALKGQTEEQLTDDYNLYLSCKHAAERNGSIAKDRGDDKKAGYKAADYYQGMGQIEYGGKRVGLSENVANQILADLQAKYGAKLSHFEDAAQKAYKIAADDLKRRLDSGLLSQSDYDFYHNRVESGEWKHYVPLRTDRARLGIDASDMEMAGSRLHRNEFRKARGRGEGDAATAPFTDLILQAEQGIRKSIANEVANVEANVVDLAERRGLNSVTRTNPDGSTRTDYMFAEVVPGEDIGQHGKNHQFTFADGTTALSEGGSRLVEKHPEIHLFKRDGKLYAIRYNKGANGRGEAYAKAASGDNMGRWGSGLEWVPKFTHWMSAMRTQYSPEFTISNLFADNLEAAQALIGRYGFKDGLKKFGKALKTEWTGRKDLIAYLRDGKIQGRVGEAMLGGLLTKGGVASAGYEGTTKNIKSRVSEFMRKEKAWRDMSLGDYAKSAGKHIKDYISFANELAEYSTRMGIFTALRDSGVPINEAVKFARDATVNFNRKGTAMPYINGLYMFANASVQGAVRSVQAMTDARGKELIYTLVGIGVAKAVIDNVLGNDDEREKAGGRNARNLSEYDKKHNVGIPVGGGMQVVPFRFRGPYAAIPYLAQTAANVAMGVTKPEDGGLSLLRELGDQVTDIVGGNGVLNDKGEPDKSLIAQSLAPSIADPIIQWASGKNYKGEDIAKKSYDKTAPQSWNGKRSTSAFFTEPAKFLNSITGGSEFRKGWLDTAPENLQLITEFIFGGPGRDFVNTLSSARNVAQIAAGGTPERPLSQAPFLRRVIREYPENTSRYFDALDAYERDKAEFKKTTDIERRREMKKEKPYLFTGKSLLDGQIDKVKELTHLERGEVKSGNKWVEPKTPRSEAQKEKYRELRLKLQATILRQLKA